MGNLQVLLKYLAQAIATGDSDYSHFIGRACTRIVILPGQSFFHIVLILVLHILDDYIINGRPNANRVTERLTGIVHMHMHFDQALVSHDQC